MPGVSDVGRNSRDVPGQNVKSAGMFLANIVSQRGCFSANYKISRGLSVQNIRPVGVF